MEYQDSLVIILLTGVIFLIVYVINHPTNKPQPPGAPELMEADNFDMRYNKEGKWLKKQFNIL